MGFIENTAMRHDRVNDDDDDDDDDDVYSSLLHSLETKARRVDCERRWVLLTVVSSWNNLMMMMMMFITIFAGDYSSKGRRRICAFVRRSGRAILHGGPKRSGLAKRWSGQPFSRAEF